MEDMLVVLKVYHDGRYGLATEALLSPALHWERQPKAPVIVV